MGLYLTTTTVTFICSTSNLSIAPFFNISLFEISENILLKKIDDPSKHGILISFLAKEVERILFRDALSMEAYINVLTLRKRVIQTLWKMKNA